MHSTVRKTLGFKRDVVALVGSTASTPHQWRHMGGALSKTCEVVMPHLWDVGAVPRWQGGEHFSLMDDAKILKRQLDAYEDPVHLVAHSYGAAVALVYARTWPERVASLVLFEPTVFGLLQVPRHNFDYDSFKEVYDVAKMATTAAAYDEHKSDVRHVVNFWHGKDAWSNMSAEEKSGVKKALPKMGLEFIATLWPETHLLDYAGINMPVTILRGADTSYPMRRIAFDLAKLIPMARLCTVADAGHMLPITHSEDVLPLVVGHIQNAKPHFQRAA